MSPKVIAAAILALGVASQGLAATVKVTHNHQTGAVHKVKYHHTGIKSRHVSKDAVSVQYAALHESSAVPQEIRIQSAEEVFTHNSCCP